MKVISYIAIIFYIIGIILACAGIYLDSEIFVIQNFSRVGICLILLTFYFVYKLNDSKSNNKQLHGSLLIANSILFIFYGLKFESFGKALEESSISNRFAVTRGIVGKGVKQLEDGSETFQRIAIPNINQNIKIIGITTNTLEKLQGTWPINWSMYAKIVDGFKNSTNTVFFDIFFVDYKKGQMELMEKSLKGSTNMIFDYSIESTSESKDSVINLESRLEKLRRFQLKNVIDKNDLGKVWLNFASPPIEHITENSTGIGFANIRKEDQKSNRKMPLVVKLINHGPNKETEFFPSIDLVTVCNYYGVDLIKDTEVVFGEYVKIKNIPKKMITNLDGQDKDIMNYPNEAREIKIPIDYFGQMQINFEGSLFSFEDYDIFDVADFGKEFANNFKNHIFLTAMYYATGRGASKDTHLSPFGEISGIEHHAHAINTILNQRFLTNAPEILNLIVLIILGLGFAYLQSRFKTYTSILLFFAVVILYYLITTKIFDLFDFIIIQPTIIISILFIFVSIIAYKILAEEENVKFIRTTFSKFVSKDVVDELLKNPDMIALGGARKEITIFFSDVRGFTTLSEALSPEDLVKLLNEYLTTMTDLVIEYKGTIDKYMGDAIMAFWGAPIALEDHPYYACVASLVQMDKLKELQISLAARNLPTIDIGIGLNSGHAVVGNMGSSHQMNYTVMGDTINLGSRLEGSNKTYGTNIIISEYTYERVKDRVYARELDLVQVKGKTQPVRIYELIGLVNDADMELIRRPLSSR